MSELTNEQHFRLWKQSLCSIFLIGEVPKEDTKFYHEIAIYHGTVEVDYVFMRTHLIRHDAHYFLDKSVATAEYGSHESSSSRGNIEYCLWRVRACKEGGVEVVAEA